MKCFQMYNPRYRSHFTKDIKNFRRKKDKKSINIIQKGIENLLLPDPYNNSESLTGPLKGKRKYKKSDVRIIFAICEECRKLGHTPLNGCNDCSSYEDNTLMFFKTGLRGNIYE